MPMTDSVGDFPRCIEGALACPPENIGGTPGFEEFLDAIANPQNAEHEGMCELYGAFDLDKFDTNETTIMMQCGLPY